MRRPSLLPLVHAVFCSRRAAAPPISRSGFMPIDAGASETAAVADVNRDGRLDIISGEHWYEAQPRRGRSTASASSDSATNTSTTSATSSSTSTATAIPTSCRSRGSRSGRVVAQSRQGGQGSEVEGGADPRRIQRRVRGPRRLDNDGKAQEILAQENGTGQAWYEVKDKAWVAHVVSDATYGHGIGAGDVNGDKRNDILTPRGWLEAPADPRAGNWTFHPDWESINVPATPAADAAQARRARACQRARLHARPRRQRRRPQRRRHRRRPRLRRLLVRAGRGRQVDAPDDRQRVVTGPRIDARRSQRRRTAGPRHRQALHGAQRQRPWREGAARASTGTSSEKARPAPEWIRHVIDYGGRMGGGMQIPVVDIDRDGDPDLVCAGKSGLFFVENLTKRKR